MAQFFATMIEQGGASDLPALMLLRKRGPRQGDERSFAAVVFADPEDGSAPRRHDLAA
ncbi:hypothetical protein [Falsirhodobacter xinxiangensis]|uniref:hypothetical protein n=1 Tax=Falsirhodobacter xinxiangensis TaxID=2530049 RepID=UPI00145A1F68|nr:hypothetical protein [Rhodobacter xinxiangensis]